MTRVMIVEDDYIIQNELVFMSEDIGHNIVSTANTGEKAIEKIPSTDPEIILMDIKLSGDMDGIEAAKIIQEQFDIPVIFVTAYTDDKRIERAKCAHPYGYLIKPVYERDLKITIEMALYSAQINKKRLKAEVEKEKLIFELKEALNQIKTLKGLLPICSSCKKIRDGHGDWNHIESYVEKRTDAQFTHSICPSCSDKLYGKQNWYQK